MKKEILFFCTFIISVFTQAQPNLVGLTSSGGINGTGVLLEYTGGDTSLSSYYSLPAGGCPGCGATPYGSLVKAGNGKLYGLTYSDGANFAGTLFQYDYPSNTYTVMVNFNITSSGEFPFGSLMQASNGLLYGLTSGGGANGSGTLFSYSIGADSVIPMVSLPHSNGGGPFGALIQAHNGKLYGMTANDGTNSSGTIFQYDISTNSYTALYNLPSSASPYGDLLEVGADTLYGMTLLDGTHQLGTIFRFVPTSVSYDVLFNFDSLSGGEPYSSLILCADNKLYGATSSKGSFQSGTLFKFDRNASTYTKLLDFNGALGQSPYGSPYQASDDNLYGMTTSGGANAEGTIYRYDIATATFTSEFSFDFMNGATPLYGHLIEYSAPVVITTQPGSLSVCAGSSVSFTASASGSTGVQWLVSTNGGGSFANVSGATDTTYSFIASANQNGYQYKAVFSNGSAGDTTAAATLTVWPEPISTPIASICQGGAYIVGTHSYSISGSYTDTLIGASMHGCDSIVSLSLVVTIMNDTAMVNGAVCTVDGNGATYQWYPCSAGIAISGAIFQTFTASHNGFYECIVTLGGCSDTTNCVEVTSLGINQLSSYDLSLSPNPTNGSFTIENNYPVTLSVNIMNLLGERLKTYSMNGTKKSFDISDIAAGIYEVQISDANQTLKVMKVVKE